MSSFFAIKLDIKLPGPTFVTRLCSYGASYTSPLPSARRASCPSSAAPACARSARAQAVTRCAPNSCCAARVRELGRRATTSTRFFRSTGMRRGRSFATWSCAPACSARAFMTAASCSGRAEKGAHLSHGIARSLPPFAFNAHRTGSLVPVLIVHDGRCVVRIDGKTVMSFAGSRIGTTGTSSCRRSGRGYWIEYQEVWRTQFAQISYSPGLTRPQPNHKMAGTLGAHDRPHA
jgi:hypothetical protein